ncbi:hypothetical protein PVAP13_2KG269358 [Panicum virgatum]|uniref:Apple domain-containing protein n=1 Tax=Panicum virgatum TaxID=38727 RepID=A0A8T0W139_PANVG|nr:hypothetical protein PVAP13_2KG269358 [Panicum virgatum]
MGTRSPSHTPSPTGPQACAPGCPTQPVRFLRLLRLLRRHGDGGHPPDMQVPGGVRDQGGQGKQQPLGRVCEEGAAQMRHRGCGRRPVRDLDGREDACDARVRQEPDLGRLRACEAECRGNCSCTAYAYANLTAALSGGDSSRCLLWFGELVDLGKFVDIVGENLYVRLAGSSSPGRYSRAVPFLAATVSYSSHVCKLQRKKWIPLNISYIY